MKDVLSDSDIETALNELMSSVGVRSDVAWHDIRLAIQGDPKQAISMIAAHMGLPVVVSLKILPLGYRPAASDGFKSTSLVGFDYNGEAAGITAQVKIPHSLPHYGSNAMQGYPIDVVVSAEVVNEPDVFITVMAHEFSHIVLYSMRHIQKEDEFYTDLTAMLSGFSKVMKSGRYVVKKTTNSYGSSFVTHTTTTRYGYLSDSNFEYAYIAARSAVQKFDEQVWRIRKLISNALVINHRAEQAVLDFKAYLKDLDSQSPQSMSSSDAKKIVVYHQNGYIEHFCLCCENHKIFLSTMQNDIPTRGVTSAVEWTQKFERRLY